MTMRVLFNGVVLVRPGGATKVDASAFSNSALTGVGTLGMVGEADAGEPGAINIFSNAGAMKKYYRSGALTSMAGLAFRASGDPRITAGANTVVAIKTNQATKSAATLLGAGVSNASITGTATMPFALLSSAGLTIDVDGVGPATATFTGTQATKPGAVHVFAPEAGTMTIRLNGVSQFTQTITFGGAEATDQDYVDEINAQLVGGVAILNAAKIDIRSDLKGTQSQVEILTLSGTLAASTGLSTGSAASVGSNVGNLASISFTEFKTLTEAAIAGLTVTGATGQVVTITSNLSGAGSSLLVSAGVVQAALGLPTTLFQASTPVNTMTLTSQDFGAHTNLISYQVSDSGGGKIIEFTFLDGLTLKSETSPVLGDLGKLSVIYSGTSTTATLTVNSTGITTALSGPFTDGSAALNVPFSQYKSIQDIINYINAQIGYTATAVSVNPFADQGADLDYITGSNIKSVTLTMFGKLMDVVNWVNANSALVSAARVVGGPSGPIAVIKTYLAGGSRGVSTNSNWQDAFNSLGTVRVNHVAPLIAYDLVADGFGSTATVDAVNAQADAHATYYSSTGGKSERQAYLSKRGTKLQVKAAAQLLNSFNSCLCGVQRPTVLGEDGSLVEYPEYAQAVVAASMRSGAELGEPLTYKFVKYFSMFTDPSWNPALDAAEMILAGVMFVEQVPGQGFRWVKGITTYTRLDNDAFTEESVVQGWKNVAFELRTHLENIFTGTRATPASIAAVKQQAASKLESLKKAGQIVDSTLPGGTRLNAYRDLEVLTVQGLPDTLAINVTVSPVSGINFTLNTVTLVPAQLSA